MAGRTREYDVLLRGLSQGLERLAQQVERLDNKLDEIDGRRATATVDVDTKRADAKLGAFARNIQDRLRKAVADIPEVKLDIDSSEAERQLAVIRNQLALLSDKRVGIDIGAEEAQAEITRLRVDLERLARESPEIQVRADAAAALAQLRAVGAEADRLDGKSVKIDIDAGRGIAETTVQLAALARAIALLSAIAAVPLALPGLAGMGAALMDLVGVLGLVPAAGFAAGAALTTLIVGFQGFGDALKSGDTPGELKKVNEAMAGLAPSARETVTQIKALGPAWDALRLDVQQQLFNNIGQTIQRVGGAYIPILRAGLSGIATELNRGAQMWAQFALQADTLRDTSTIFTNIKTAMAALAPAGANVAAALKDIALVGSTFLPSLSAGLTGATAQFRAFIAEARQSGQLAQWIQSGITAVGQLGSILGNVGSTLMGVFRAATAAGASFLSTLDRLTQAMSNWVNSARGQDVLINLFTTLRQTVDNLLPGLIAIGDAIAQAFSTLGPVLPTVAAAFSQIATALAPVIPMLASMAAAVAPVVTGFASVVSALGPVGPAILAATVGFIAFRAALSAILGGITSLTSPIRAIAPAMTQTGTAATTAATGVRTLGTAAAGSVGAVGGLRGAMSGLMGFLGGPLGAAITAVTVALGLLGAAQANAAAAAANHQSAVQSLASTLDQTTGAVTAATAAHIAQSLATEKLSDGTTSYLQAAQQAGIATTDFTQAALGNEGALTRVNAQIRTQATQVLANSSAWASMSDIFGRTGISLQLATEAALGNNAAFAEMNRLLPGMSLQLQTWRGEAQRALGPLAEMAMKLGITNEQLKQAATQTAMAAQASIDFAGKVTIAQGALAQFGAAAITSNGAILENAAGAGELGAALAGVSKDAMSAAQAAAQVAVASGEAGKAGQMAAASMEQSRAAFINAGLAAGMSQGQMETLANSMGLIPAAIQTIIESNADPVTAQMIMLAHQMAAVPGSKSIVVTAPLLPETIAKLQTLGIDIKTLPNGQFEITPKTEAARAALEQLKTPTTSTHSVTPGTNGAAPVITQNKTPTTSIHSFRAGENGVTPVKAQNQQPTFSIHSFRAGENAIPPVTTTNSADTSNIHSFRAGENAIPAAAAANSAPTQSLHSFRVGENQVPAAAAANSQPTTNVHNVTINNAAVDTAKATNAIPTTSMHTIQVENSAPTAAIALNKQPTTSMHTIQVNNSAVEAAKAANAQSTSSTHTINVVVVGGGVPNATGSIMQPNAQGGMYGFGGGGQYFNGHKLTPMRGGVGRMVNPSTYRVIGDNTSVPEAYIPLNDSDRSKGLLGYAAEQLGYGLTPLAAGGIIDASVSERVWRRLQASMTSGGRSGRAGSSSGMSAAGVEARLDRLTSVTAQLSDTLERRGAGASIVVEAAQDPVETARATRLAMRLA